MKVIIVGGGGASCATRLRRLDEQAEILMVERGAYVSSANCGLPYHDPRRGVVPSAASRHRPPGHLSRCARCPTRESTGNWIERGTSFLAGMEKYSGFQTVRPARHAVVVGGGVIGMEMAENLVRRGFE